MGKMESAFKRGVEKMFSEEIRNRYDYSKAYGKSPAGGKIVDLSESGEVTYNKAAMRQRGFQIGRKFSRKERG